ncbi:MAG: GspE/PulE family protein, partial [Polyangiaceae bacterium]
MKFRLYNMLARDGLINEPRWQECLEAERETGESIDKILKEKGYLSEDQLLQAFQKTTGIPYYRTLAHFQVPPDFIERVSAQFARQNNLIAVGRAGGAFQIATCEPLNVHAMDELSALVESEVEPVLAPKAEITQLISRAYQRSVDGVNEMLEGIEDDEDVLGINIELDETEDVLDIANKAPIIRLVNSIFFESHKNRASDIHFQPFEDKLQVRYRIDGILYDTKVIPKKVQEAVTSRIKVMGRMDIAERRLPQDGRCTINVGDGEIDMRISSVPTSYGERIVLRLLDKTAKVFEIDNIGMSPENHKLIKQFIDYSHGI